MFVLISASPLYPYAQLRNPSIHRFGDIGKIIFTNKFSHTFDLRPKSWKFAGEWLSGAGALLMITTCVCDGRYFLLLAGGGTALRAIAWLVW